MCDYIVTEQEIKNAESVIFKSGGIFNADQVNFIKNLDTCYLQAYAGTGKTTTLVGKLHILAQKKVWEEGRAICIISHTNVAIEEVKKYVAAYYPGIMDYPNFIGTIQDFANTFLFAPHLAETGLRIRLQDDTFPYNHRWGIFNRLDGAEKNAINSAIRSYEQSGLFNRIYDDNGILFDGEPFPLEKMNKKRTHAKMPDTLLPGINEYFGQVISARRNAGKFLFDESFIDALKRLDKYPHLATIISKRFRYVFLDEAQDCSRYQLNLLNRVFNNENTVFQQIGDVNQAISEEEWCLGTPRLHLGISKRLSSSMSSLVNSLRIDEGVDLIGSEHTSHKILILYNDGHENQVLEKYCEIIKDKEIPSEDGCGYYAIACRKDPIKNFHPTYSSNPTQGGQKIKLPNLKEDGDYLNLLTKENVLKYGSNFIANILFKILYKHYKSDGQWYELRANLREGDNSERFRKLVLTISKQLIDIGNFEDTNHISSELNLLLGEEAVHFAIADPAIGARPVTTNFYESEGIRVELGSIHSVKGQTHNATLLLSILADRKQDIQHIISNTKKRGPQYKKLIYVAASRPKHLFAVALSRDAFTSLTDNSFFSDFEVLEI